MRYAFPDAPPRAGAPSIARSGRRLRNPRGEPTERAGAIAVETRSATSLGCTDASTELPPRPAASSRLLGPALRAWNAGPRPRRTGRARRHPRLRDVVGQGEHGSRRSSIHRPPTCSALRPRRHRRTPRATAFGTPCRRERSVATHQRATRERGPITLALRAALVSATSATAGAGISLLSSCSIPRFQFCAGLGVAGLERDDYARARSAANCGCQLTARPSSDLPTPSRPRRL